MIVLASKSHSRREMLNAVGVPFESVPADIDERRLEAELAHDDPAAVALALAEAKALAVSYTQSGELVLGSDSLVVIDGKRFDKPVDRTDAARHLRHFSGREMHLHSAAALAREGQVLWGHADCARLKVRELSDSFIDWYLEREWPHVAGCVGVFRIEATGPHLFEAIEGDQFTVLGMPLLPVLGALREQGVLPA